MVKDWWQQSIKEEPREMQVGNKLEITNTGQEVIFLMTGNLLDCSLLTQVPKNSDPRRLT